MLPFILTLSILVILLSLWLYSKRKSGDPDATRSDDLLESSQAIHVVPKHQLSPLMDKLVEVLGDRYDQIEPIAAGGMGLIAKAHDKTEDRFVAIKTILPELEANQRALRLFFDEGSAIQKINHPNIVRFYDVGEKEILYYIMEYLEGENLKRVLKRQRTLDIKETVHIGTQVARALQHCHENSIIHRDIKPSNIFLTDKGTVKIIDFGIVKLITDSAALAQGTTKIGSPDYAAPEQIQGQAISGKSDIYALGVCLFQMASGELPFVSANFLTRALEEPKKLKDVCPEVPDDLARVVQSCIDVDPAKRMSSMELWKNLRNIEC